MKNYQKPDVEVIRFETIEDLTAGVPGMGGGTSSGEEFEEWE